MGKPTNGPDWTDVLMSSWRLEEHHAVRITILVTGGGAFGGCPASFAVIAVPSKLDDPFEPMGWTVETSWPNKDSKTVEGTLYGALLRLDELLCEKRWTQLDITA